jgi:flagellar hook assembly protein FlgD
VRPNPFQRNTTIFYQAAAGAVELSIYDATGRRVRTLVDTAPGEGVRSVTWNGDGEGGGRVRAGVYYARLRSGTVVSAKPLVIMD